MSANRNRSLSRLVATQALFTIEATRRPFRQVLVQIESKTAEELLDSDEMINDYDHDYMHEIVGEAVNSQIKIDNVINPALKKGWPLKSIDPILRALFRAAAAEMLMGRAPTKVILNEYIEVAKAFDETRETVSFVNAVLDQISKTLES